MEGMDSDTLMGLLKDKTKELKQAEKKLKKAEKKYLEIYKTNKDL